MSRTSRSMRGRCVVLAAVTAGVSWLATGHAMADGATVTGSCKPQNQSKPANLTTLTPPTGVLSIADTAGAAAGHGLTSMPGRPATTAKGRAAHGVQDAAGKSAPGRPGTLPAAAPDASTVLPAAPNSKKAAPAGAQATPQAVAKAVPAEMPNPAPAVDAAQSVAKQVAMGASAAAKAAQPATTVPTAPLMAIAPARPSVTHQACTPEAATTGTEHNPQGRHSGAEGRGKNDKATSRSGADFLPAHPHGRPHHKVPPAVTQPADEQHGGQNAAKPADTGRHSQENAEAKGKQADQGRAQGHRRHDADAKTRSTEGANTRTGVIHPKAPAHPNGAVPSDLTAPALAKTADTGSVTTLANNATDSTILP